MPTRRNVAEMLVDTDSGEQLTKVMLLRRSGLQTVVHPLARRGEIDHILLDMARMV